MPTATLRRYYEVYRRHNYTTPKSYLELIALYKSLLARKREELRQAKERLENGARWGWGRGRACDLQPGLWLRQRLGACGSYYFSIDVECFCYWDTPSPTNPPTLLHRPTQPCPCGAAGVDKISQASKAVADLQQNLVQEMVIVEEKKATTQVSGVVGCGPGLHAGNCGPGQLVAEGWLPGCPGPPRLQDQLGVRCSLVTGV